MNFLPPTLVKLAKPAIHRAFHGGIPEFGLHTRTWTVSCLTERARSATAEKSARWPGAFRGTWKPDGSTRSS